MYLLFIIVSGIMVFGGALGAAICWDKRSDLIWGYGLHNHAMKKTKQYERYATYFLFVIVVGLFIGFYWEYK